MSNIHSDVQNYYGQQLQQSSDLKTDACCTKVVVPLFIRKILQQIHPDIIAKFVVFLYVISNGFLISDIMAVV